MDRRQLLAVMMAASAGIGAPSSGQAATPFHSGRMTVTVEGRGPDVVLVPGLSSSPTVWRPLVDSMKDRYRFHLVQIRGFAGLPKGDNVSGPVAAPVAEEIARYIRSANLKRPAVIGHSMGGTITMMVAARHPDLVGRAMVIDMPPFMGLFMGGPQATPASMAPMAEQVRKAMAEGPLDQYRKRQDDTLAGMVQTQAALPRIRQEAHDSDRDVSARAYAELMTTDLRPELPKITAPLTVLFAWTPQYPMKPEQLEAAYAALFAPVKGARTVRIPDSRHFIMADQPERFRSEVATFLAG